MKKSKKTKRPELRIVKQNFNDGTSEFYVEKLHRWGKYCSSYFIASPKYDTYDEAMEKILEIKNERKLVSEEIINI